LVKTLSVKQPYATLICAGVKRVENRTWKTDYRGRLLIHASGDSWAYPDFNMLPEKLQENIMPWVGIDDWSDAPDTIKNYTLLLEKTFNFYGKDYDEQEPPQEWLKEAVKKYGFFLTSQAIIGEVTLSDIVANLHDLDNDDTDFAEPGCYYWIMDDPVLYEKPIINVMGHLKLWSFDKSA
jgi:hypothetical protein